VAVIHDKWHIVASSVVRRRHASDFNPGSVTFVDGFGDKSMNMSLNLHAIVHARRHASDFNPGSVTFVGGAGH
jgi:hypothetical protein